jgi:hypothetical protein
MRLRTRVAARGCAVVNGCTHAGTGIVGMGLDIGANVRGCAVVDGSTHVGSLGRKTCWLGPRPLGAIPFPESPRVGFEACGGRL